jgi:ABC-type multidrug transport system ATPase subunit
MGASGAGKTSLFNIIADRVPLPPKGMLSGNILFNDEIPVNRKNFAKYAAYVQQEDILFPRFTIREALRFSARLKLTIPDEEQDKRIEMIIHDLGL